MPTAALVEQRNWLRLPVTIPASFVCIQPKRTVSGRILNLSEAGIGFATLANMQSHEGVSVCFWLPYVECRPNDTMFEPVTVRLSVVSSRYSAADGSYAYSGVFVGLHAGIRSLIRAYVSGVAGQDRVGVKD